MFGRAEWFRLKVTRSSLRPTSWKGWAYSVAWWAIIGAPGWALWTQHRRGEALIWLLASSVAWRWDLRQVRKHLAKSRGDVLYIGDEMA